MVSVRSEDHYCAIKIALVSSFYGSELLKSSYTVYTCNEIVEEKTLDEHPNEHGGPCVFQDDVKHFTYDRCGVDSVVLQLVYG